MLLQKPYVMFAGLVELGIEKKTGYMIYSLVYPYARHQLASPVCYRVYQLHGEVNTISIIALFPVHDVSDSRPTPILADPEQPSPPN